MVGGLVAGGNTTIQYPHPYVPHQIGAHIIRVQVDTQNEVLEYDELNNEASRAILVGLG